MMKLARNGLWLLGALTLLGSLALSAYANPWIRFDFESSYSGFANIDGIHVPGTWSASVSYIHRWDDGVLHFKGHQDQDFVSDDGSIVGHAVGNFNYRLRDDQPLTYTRTYHVNFFQQGVGLVQRLKLTQHSTYNANGELVSLVDHFDW